MLIDTKFFRRKILDLAIWGKLVPQDPNDEPASELLKRIHAEKAALVKSGKLKKEKPLPSISQDEIPFEIPASWEWVRLGTIATVVTGATPPTTSETYYGGTIPFIKPPDLGLRKYIESSSGSLTKGGAEKSRLIPPNSICVCCIGSLGKTSISQEFLCTNQQINSLLPLINVDYLYYVCLSVFFQDSLQQASTAVTIALVNKSKMEHLLIPLPPLEEQKRIAAAVEALMNEVDTIEREVENINRIFAQTREKVLDLAIRGKLVPQNPNDEPASELLKRINAEKAAHIKSGKLKKEKPLPPITQDEIPFDIPDTWEWVRLVSLGSVIGGGTPSTSVPEYWDGTIPWLSPCDLSDYNGKYIGRGKRNISQEGLDHSSAALMPAGSILYSSRAPIGYVVIASNEISTNQGFKSLVPVIDGISEFIYYALKALTPDIRNRATGTTFKEISGSEFGKTLLPLPPLAEQKRIVEKLESIFSTLDMHQ